ncbi:hypothetical protein IT414_04065 [bacterium]|nr:hypothetical protein [bacterium]
MSVVVNLLPEARLVKLRNRRRKQLATGGLIFVALVVGTIIGTLLFLLAANAANESLVKGDIERFKKDVADLRDVEQTAADLQEHLDSFYKLNADRLFASSVFGNLSNTIQPNVVVNSFEISDSDTASGSSSTDSSSSLSLATIKGLADDYKAVSTFAQAIEAYNVTYKKDRPESQRFNLDPGQALFSKTNITKSSQDLKTGKVSYEMTFLLDRNLIKGSSPGTVTTETNQ